MSIGWSFRSTTMFYSVVGVTYLTMSAVAIAGPFDKNSLANTAVPFGAVDGVNGKGEAFAGSLANRSLFGTRGSVSFPLSQIGVLNNQYGAQIDAGLGTYDGRSYGNIGGHLFWRDPGRGLVGIYTDHTWWNQFSGVYLGRVAGEGEYYFGRWTIQGIAGVEFGNSASNTISSNSIIPAIGGGNGGNGTPPGVATVSTFTDAYNVKTRFFDEINFKYYLTDNWDGYVGHRYLGGKNAFALGTEYAMQLNNGILASVFLEGRVAESNAQGIWGGVRFYFNKAPKSLMARHREDDPIHWGPMSNLLAIIAGHSTSSSSSSSQFCIPGETLTGSSCEAPF